MWGSSAVFRKSPDDVTITTGAFELVCRMAGATIEQPPRSKQYANGNASRIARSTDARPAVQPIVATRYRCCAPNSKADSVAARMNERPRRRRPKTKPRWITSSVMPLTSTTPSNRAAQSARNWSEVPFNHANAGRKNPHRQADADGGGTLTRNFRRDSAY